MSLWGAEQNELFSSPDFDDVMTDAWTESGIIIWAKDAYTVQPLGYF